METSAITVNYSSQLTPDIINYLNNSLSKFCVAILRELYNTPQMQQKTLAANIHTSVTSLCNILGRLEEIRPQLLVSERVGRAKYYSLTEIANLYVAQIVLPQTAHPHKIHKFSTLSQENTMFSEATNAFYRFREAAGKDWDLILDNILFYLSQDHKQELLSFETDELFNLSLDFLNYIKKLKVLNETTTLHEIYDILGQSLLIKRLEKYLSKELQDFYALKPLFEIEQQNYVKAIQIIDQIFIELDPNTPVSRNTATAYSDILSPEQYMQIFHQICMMRKDFSENMSQNNKNTILQHWFTIYPVQSYCLPYIAEKCIPSSQ